MSKMGELHATVTEVADELKITVTASDWFTIVHQLRSVEVDEQTGAVTEVVRDAEEVARQVLGERAQSLTAMTEICAIIGEWITEQGWEGVAVPFQGYGDSGNFEEVIAYTKFTIAELPHYEDEQSAENFDHVEVDARIWTQKLGEWALQNRDDADLGGVEVNQGKRLEALRATPLSDCLDKQVSETLVELSAHIIDAAGYGGWENNEGAYGQVRFGKDGGVALDYYGRYTAATRHSEAPLQDEPITEAGLAQVALSMERQREWQEAYAHRLRNTQEA